MAVDDAYSKILLHFNGDDGSIVFTDEAGGTWTRYNDQLSLDQDRTEYGSASLLHNHVPSGDVGYLERTGGLSAELDPGSGDFTFNFSLYFPDTFVPNWPTVEFFNFRRLYNVDSFQLTLNQTESSNNTYYMEFRGRASSVNLGYNYFGTNVTPLILLPFVWYQFEFCRYGNDYILFLDGNLIGTASKSAHTYVLNSGGFARIFTSNHEANLDEFRYSVGIARHTTSFTPPTEEFAPEPPPPIRHWIGGGGNWNDTAHWSLTSGGLSGAPVPSITDTVIFDENSITTFGQTINFNVSGQQVPSLDFTNILNNPSLYLRYDVKCYGDLILKSGMVTSSYNNNNCFLFYGSGVIDSAGTNCFNIGISFWENSTYEIISNFETNFISFWECGVITISCDTITLSGEYPSWGNYGAAELNMGTCDIIFNNDQDWGCCFEDDGNRTETSPLTVYNDIIFNGFIGETLSYVDIEIWGPGIIVNSMEFYNSCEIYMDGGNQWGNDEDVVIQVDNFVCDGTTEKQALLEPSGYNISFTKTSGEVNVSYTSISSSLVSGGAKWYSLLDNGNIDSGNNSGWIWFIRPILYLEDDLTCQNLLIYDGIDSQEHNINTPGIVIIPGRTDETVILDNSTINCLKFKIDDPNNYINSNNILADVVIGET